MITRQLAGFIARGPISLVTQTRVRPVTRRLVGLTTHSLVGFVTRPLVGLITRPLVGFVTRRLAGFIAQRRIDIVPRGLISPITQRLVEFITRRRISPITRPLIRCRARHLARALTVRLRIATIAAGLGGPALLGRHLRLQSGFPIVRPGPPAFACRRAVFAGPGADAVLLRRHGLGGTLFRPPGRHLLGFACGQGCSALAGAQVRLAGATRAQVRLGAAARRGGAAAPVGDARAGSAVRTTGPRLAPGIDRRLGAAADTAVRTCCPAVCLRADSVVALARGATADVGAPTGFAVASGIGAARIGRPGRITDLPIGCRTHAFGGRGRARRDLGASSRTGGRLGTQTRGRRSLRTRARRRAVRTGILPGYRCTATRFGTGR